MVLSEHESVQDEIAKEEAMFKAEDDRLVSGFTPASRGRSSAWTNQAQYGKVPARPSERERKHHRKTAKFNASKKSFKVVGRSQEKEREKKMRDGAKKQRIRQVAQMKEK